MTDISDPPWVVEIDGLKFATPEAVVILLKAVSEERDVLRAVTDDLQTVFTEHVDDEINVAWIRDKLEALDAE